MPGTSGLRRQRSLNDAASALVALTGSPDAPAVRRQKLTAQPTAQLSDMGPPAPRSASGDSSLTLQGYQHNCSGSSSDEDNHAWPVHESALPANPPPPPAACVPGTAPGIAQHALAARLPAYPVQPLPKPAPTAAQKSDAQLLTSTSVLLASCGLVSALERELARQQQRQQQQQEQQQSSGTGASSSTTSPSRASSVASASEGAAEPPPLVPSDPQASGSGETAETDAAPPPSDDLPAHFSGSVWRILREECGHVRALDNSDFARLCQLLDLPLETGVAWQSRVMQLQRTMREHSEGHRPLPPDALGATGSEPGAGAGECAAAAEAAFEAALLEEKGSARSAVRRFGRQTVWCTVALLRRVLRETSGQLAPEDEARLAALAVETIGGSDQADA